MLSDFQYEPGTFLHEETPFASIIAAHTYDPFDDYRIYKVIIWCAELIAEKQLLKMFRKSFGKSNLLSSLIQTNGGHIFASYQWRAKCKCRPQSQYHLDIGNQVIDEIYDQYRLSVGERAIVDRLLCFSDSSVAIHHYINQFHSILEYGRGFRCRQAYSDIIGIVDQESDTIT